MAILNINILYTYIFLQIGIYHVLKSYKSLARISIKNIIDDIHKETITLIYIYMYNHYQIKTIFWYPNPKRTNPIDSWKRVTCVQKGERIKKKKYCTLLFPYIPLGNIAHCRNFVIKDFPSCLTLSVVKFCCWKIFTWQRWICIEREICR